MNGAQVPEQGLDAYDEELERTKSQLLVFARDMSLVYQQEREKTKELGEINAELKTNYLSMVQTLAMVVEAKDQYTRNHLDRCRDYGSALTLELEPGILSDELKYGFLLHDIGKIGVPEPILMKPGPLTDEEMAIMQRHPLIGVQLVEPMRKIFSDETFQVIRHHHERYDGGGYPDHLKGDDVPLPARIFTVVDSYDAMTTDRPYRKALAFAEAARRLREGAGTQFDPDAVEAFIKMMTEQDAAKLEKSSGSERGALKD